MNILGNIRPEHSSGPKEPENPELEEAPRAPDEDVVLEQQMREEEAAAPAVEEKMDQVVVEPFDVSNVVVNGIELTAESSPSSLRAACGFHRLSTSGSKQKCYRRLVTYMQNQELEAAKEAVNVGERAHYRDPRMQPAANKPSDEEVAKHNLTHTPYQGWCEHCIAHRARPDRHERTDEARTGKMPTISFEPMLHQSAWRRRTRGRWCFKPVDCHGRLSNWLCWMLPLEKQRPNQIGHM